MRQFQAGPPNSFHDVFAFGFSPDSGSLVASVLHEGIFLWDLASGSLEAKHLPHNEKLYNRDFLFTPDGRLTWVNTSGRWTYDPVADVVSKTNMPTGGSINGQILLAGDRLLTGHGFDRMGVGLWQQGAPEDWSNLWFFDFRGSFFDFAAGFHADQFYLLQGKGPSDPDYPTLTVRSFASREVIAQVPFISRGARKFQAAPDGSFVVSVLDATLVLWRPGEKLTKVRPCGRKHITDIAFHPSGNYLAATSNDTTVRLLSTENWSVVEQYAWEIGSLKAVAFNADGTLAAAGGTHGQVVVWDVEV